MIARLTDTPERRLRAAIERSAGLEVEVTDRPPGAVVALVTCTGGCGIRHLLATERHQVTLHHNATVTCDCVARTACKHAAALVFAEAGVLPPPPPSSRGFAKPCVLCGKPGFAILRGWDGHCEEHPW